MFHRADVRDPSDLRSLVDATVDRYGGIDVLVNNAAIETDTTPDEIDIETWEDVVETDFRGYWLVAKYAHEHLSKSDLGTVVNVGSNHATATQPKKFPYNAVKAGIDGMTRAMATAWGKDGIRVNSVNPGWTGVERVTESLSDEKQEHLKQIHPLNRIGTPEEIAETALFLASEMASFVTGSCLVVDGGRTAVLQDDLYVDDIHGEEGHKTTDDEGY
jgi:NAD(P)-dependent dehydrogenase (short-subunit alcohol dehydrogenase family)